MYPKIAMPQTAQYKLAKYQFKLDAYLKDTKAFLSAYRVFPGTTIGTWNPPYDPDADDVNDTFTCVASATVVLMEGVAGKSALDQKAFMTRVLKDIDDKFEFCRGYGEAAVDATYAVATDRCVSAGAKASDIARMVMLFVQPEKIRCYGV